MFRRLKTAIKTVSQVVWRVVVRISVAFGTLGGKFIKVIVKTGRLSTRIIKLWILPLIAVLVIWACYMELRSHIVEINPFEVSSEMAAAGYTGNTIQKLFSTQLQKIQKGAVSRLSDSSHLRPAVAESDVDIKVPQTEISLRGLIRYIRDLLGIPVTRISGSCITKNRALIVSISITGNESFEIPATWAAFDQSKPLEEALLQAAEKTFLQIEPFTAAAYNYNQGNRDKAMSAIGKCLENQKADYQALALWGRVLADRGKYPTAIEKFDESLQLKPGYLHAALHKANALDESGQREDALKSYNAIIKANPKEINGYIDRGICFTNLKRYRQAADDFEKALKFDRYSNTAKELLIGNKPDLNETSSAIQMCAELVALYPKSPRWYQLSGDVLAKAEDYPKAIESFSKALQLATTSAGRSDATFGRGRCYHAIRDWAKAANDYKASLNEDPDKIENPSQMAAWYNLGVVLRAQNGTTWEVLQCFENAVKLAPNDDDCLSQRGYAYKYFGMSNEAKADFAAVIANKNSPPPSRQEAQEQLATLAEIERAKSKMLDLAKVSKAEPSLTSKKKKKDKY